LGFKDRDLLGDPLARMERQLLSQIALDRIFGASSEIRDQLQQRGLLDDSMSCSYMGERTFGFAVLSCESEQPDELAETLREIFAEPIVIDADHLERAKRRALGHYLRSFDSLSAMAFAQSAEALEGIAPFSLIERLAKLDCGEIEARHLEMVRADSFARVVVGG